MARTNTLTNFLTDVASAIKQKTGDNTLIPASEFDTEILSIQTGGVYQTKSLTIAQNGNYTLLPDNGYDAISQFNLAVNVEDPEYQSNLSLSRQLLGNAPVLPYIELDYIYDTGSAYINTGIAPSSNTKLEFGVVDPSTVAYWCGSLTYSGGSSWWAREAYAVCNDGSTMYIAYNNSNSGTGDATSITTTSQIIYYHGKVTVNGTDKFQITPYDETFQLTYPLFIFAQNRRGSYSKGDKGSINCKISYFKIYEDSVLVRDLIPVKRKSDNVVCMYDKVTDQFFTNAGGGSFVAGPVKV